MLSLSLLLHTVVKIENVPYLLYSFQGKKQLSLSTMVYPGTFIDFRIMSAAKWTDFQKNELQPEPFDDFVSISNFKLAVYAQVVFKQ